MFSDKMLKRFEAIFLFLSFTIVLGGCGQNGDSARIWQAQDIRPEKNQAALESCQEISIPQDLSLNGHLFYYYPRCFVDQTSESTLAPLLNMQEQMGGLETMEHIAELVSHKQKLDEGKISRPVLKSFASFFSKDSIEFWQESANLAEAIYPGRLVNWIYDLATRGELVKLWQKSVVFFSPESWPIWSPELRAILEDGEYRSTITEFLNSFFKLNVYSDLANWLTPQKTGALDRDSKGEVLKKWLDPITNFEDNPHLSSVGLEKTHQGPISGAQRFDYFWNQMLEGERVELINVVSLLTEQLALMGQERRENLLKGLFLGGQKNLQRQSNPFGHIISLLHLAKETKVADIYPLIIALSDLLEQPSAMVPLNKKFSSHILAQEVLTAMKTGSDTLCPGLTLPALGGIETTRDVFKSNLILWMKPHESCFHGLSPVSALIQNKIDTALNCSAQGGYNEDDPDRFCINPYEYKKISDREKSLLGSQFLDKESFSENEEVNKNRSKFIDYIYQKWGEKLDRDPWELNRINLALGPIEKDQWQEIFNPFLIAQGQIDKLQMAMAENFQKHSKLLGEDFLIELVKWELNELGTLKAMSERNWDEVSDQSFYPQALGFGPGGYWSRLVTESFYAKNLPEDLVKSFPGKIKDLDEILFKARISGGFFKDFSRTLDDSEVDFKGLGMSRLSGIFREFQGEKFVGLNRGKVPLKLENIFQNSKNSPNRLELFFKGDLLGRDIPGSGEAAQKVTAWLNDTFRPIIGENDFWKQRWERSINDSVPEELFSITNYGDLKNIRASYYLMSSLFLTATGFLPPVNSYVLSEGAEPKKQFLTWPTVKDLNQEFRKLVPHALGSGEDFITPSEIFAQMFLLKDWQDYQEVFQPGLWSPNQLTEENLSASHIGETQKLLGMLHLLTTNENEQGQPLIGDYLWCWDSSGERVDCPIILTGNDSEKFATLFQYMKDNFLLRFCPLWEEQNSLENKEIKTFLEISKLNLNDEDLKRVCQREGSNLLHQAYAIRGTKKELAFSKENLIPTKVIVGQINKAVKLGPKTTLLKGIESLGLDLAIEGNHLQNWEKKNLSMPFFIPAHAETLQRLISESRGFYLGIPDFIGELILHQSLIYPSKVGVWQNRLNRLGAGVGSEGNPNRGRVYQFVQEMILIPAMKTEWQEKSVLTFLWDRLKYLRENPQSIEILWRMMDRQTDYEALESFAKAIPLYIRSFEEGFDWSKNELFFLKQVLRRDLHRSAFDYLSSMGGDSLRDLLKILEKITRTLLLESPKYPEALVGFLSDQSLSGETDYFIMNGQKILRVMFLNQAFIDEQIKISSILLPSLVKTRADWREKEGQEGQNKLKILVKNLGQNVPPLLDQLSSINWPTDFFRQMTREIFLPLGNKKYQKSLEKISSFFKSEKLPLMGEELYPFLAEERVAGHLEIMASGLNRVTIGLAQGSLKSIKIILQSSQKILTFLESKIVWDREVASDTMNAFHQMVWMCSEGQIILDHQLSALEKWGSVNGQGHE